MVGLPARGKTYISKKLTRYLNWIGVPTKGEPGPQARAVALSAVILLVSSTMQKPDLLPLVVGTHGQHHFWVTSVPGSGV